MVLMQALLVSFLLCEVLSASKSAIVFLNKVPSLKQLVYEKYPDLSIEEADKLPLDLRRDSLAHVYRHLVDKLYYCIGLEQSCIKEQLAKLKGLPNHKFQESLAKILQETREEKTLEEHLISRSILENIGLCNQRIPFGSNILFNLLYLKINSCSQKIMALIALARSFNFEMGFNLENLDIRLPKEAITSIFFDYLVTALEARSNPEAVHRFELLLEDEEVRFVVSNSFASSLYSFIHSDLALIQDSNMTINQLALLTFENYEIIFNEVSQFTTFSIATIPGINEVFKEDIKTVLALPHLKYKPNSNNHHLLPSSFKDQLGHLKFDPPVKNYSSQSETFELEQVFNYMENVVTEIGITNDNQVFIDTVLPEPSFIIYRNNHQVISISKDKECTVVKDDLVIFVPDYRIDDILGNLNTEMAHFTFDLLRASCFKVVLRK